MPSSPPPLTAPRACREAHGTRWDSVGGLAPCASAVLGPVGAGGPARAGIEQPRCEVLAMEGSFELRQYAPTIVAEVTVPGGRDTAVNAGFKVLAGYIFGANVPKQKIEMTAPVTQQPGEKIAMTAPVTQQSKGGEWIARLVLPSSWTMQTLPKPVDPRVRLEAVPGRKMAAIRFSGFHSDASYAEKAAALSAEMEKRGLRPAGPADYAYYDPPWTPPFKRRNGVLWPVK
ncbi:heme-binding protein [Nostoc sp. NIES-2111]